MCGRYGMFTDADEAAIRKIIKDVEGRIKTGEVYPTNLAPVLLPEAGELKTTVMQWGFPPFKEGGRVMINARSETAAERPVFGKSLRERRCIIPSTGFFEWGQAGEEEESGQLSFSPAKKPKKIKYLFNRPGTRALYMAGIYRQQAG